MAREEERCQHGRKQTVQAKVIPFEQIADSAREDYTRLLLHLAADVAQASRLAESAVKPTLKAETINVRPRRSSARCF